MRHRVALALAAILLAGGAARFVSLERIPPGLYFDEAIMGVEGAAALDSRSWQWFYPANNGREGLAVNLAGIATRLFGPSAFALRFWPALFGTITIAGVLVLTRALLLWRRAALAAGDETARRALERRADRVGMLAAGLMATSFWHIAMSRIGLPAVFVPCVLVWSFALLLQASSGAGAESSRASRLRALAGGALFGAGFTPTWHSASLRSSRSSSSSSRARAAAENRRASARASGSPRSGSRPPSPPRSRC